MQWLIAGPGVLLSERLVAARFPGGLATGLRVAAPVCVAL